MTPQDYVTFDTANLLKAAGYPQNKVYCKHYDNELRVLMPSRYDCTKMEESAAAPHLWDAMKWLREEKIIHIGINKRVRTEHVDNAALIEKTISYYMPTICTLSFERWLMRCDTYEQAADAGIAAACEWLIGEENNEKITEK